MANISDYELVSKILDATEFERIDWQKTAVEAQFAAAFGGKWTVTIDKSTNAVGEPDFWLSLQNAEGETILAIDDDSRLPRLFELARRHALKVNAAIADFLKELDKP
jgi:hypothetical protein